MRFCLPSGPFAAGGAALAAAAIAVFATTRRESDADDEDAGVPDGADEAEACYDTPDEHDDVQWTEPWGTVHEIAGLTRAGGYCFAAEVAVARPRRPGP